MNEIERVFRKAVADRDVYGVMRALNQLHGAELKPKMKSERATCGDCGVKEGQLHVFGCDMEPCPACGGQLISCDCNEYMALVEAERAGELKSKKRIPFIVYPNLCAKCGALWPEMFSVPDAEWEHYVEPRMRDAMLCEACYAHIRACVDGEGRETEPTEQVVTRAQELSRGLASNAQVTHDPVNGYRKE